MGAPGAIADLIDWWTLAGVDSLVHDEPRSWFAPQELARAAVPSEPRPAELAVADPYADLENLEQLQQMVRASFPRAPFWDGDPASGLMILGEALSAEDLKTGRPFSGPAGKLLDRMLAAIGLDRKGCYIGLLCATKRAPGAPSPEDIAAELPLVRAHVRLARPRLLLLLGANPVHALTRAEGAISRIRGSWLDVEAGGRAVPALATFNPAYLLRRPESKAEAWSDLLALKRRLAQ